MEIAPPQTPPPPGRATPDTGSAPPGDAASAADAADQDFDSFLRLLTAQLRNQDPLKPIDSTEFVAQLASFSSVEQLIGVNEKLEELASRDDLAGMTGLLGMEAGLPATGFRADGSEMDFQLSPVPGAETAVLTIRGTDGALLREIPFDPSLGGAVTWDGRDAAGSTVASGGLTAGITAADAAGETVSAGPVTLFAGVEAIRVVEGRPRLVLEDGRSAAPDELTGLRPARETDAAET